MTKATHGLEQSAALCHCAGMAKQNAKAGGFLWMVAIVAGTSAGLAAGNPMAGVLIGTAAGAALAVGVWLADRRR